MSSKTVNFFIKDLRTHDEAQDNQVSVLCDGSLTAKRKLGFSPSSQLRFLD